MIMCMRLLSTSVIMISQKVISDDKLSFTLCKCYCKYMSCTTKSQDFLIT